MGSIKGTAIQRLGDELIKQNFGKFSEDFEKNKKVLDSIKKIESKRVRNILAGYITKKIKKDKKKGL